MELTEEDVEKCLSKAHEIAARLTEQYNLYSQVPRAWPRSVQDLHWMTTQYIGSEIPVQELRLSALANGAKGTFIAHGGGNYEILILAELSERDRRMTQAKELFHVLLDEDSSRSLDLYAHVEATVECFHIASSKPKKKAVVFEFLAEIAAMEFLFPYSERVDIVRNSNGDIDYASVAHKYNIPQVEAEMFLSSGNMEELGKIFKE
jgi:Zn-dependent peptidase ImmA (M78 family)